MTTPHAPQDRDEEAPLEPDCDDGAPQGADRDDGAAQDADQGMSAPQFPSAEAWLAARGIQRQSLAAPLPDQARLPARAAVGLREAVRLAEEGPSQPADPRPQPSRTVQEPHPPHDAASRSCEEARPDERHDAKLEDVVGQAVAYARRATANTAMSEQRLRAKLDERGFPRAAIEPAMARARSEGLVDDEGYAAAFVDERRRKGHAPYRIRSDLQQRGLPDDLIDAAIGRFDREDVEAQAFDLARRKAAGLRGVAAETAFRRVLGYLGRRGYPEAVARKVARQVVWVDREPQRVAER